MKKRIVIGIQLLTLTISPSKATVPYIALRSQSNNDARALYERRIPYGDYATAQTELGLTVMYEQSRANTHINQCLFGADLMCGNSILIQGSHVNNGARDEQAWLADYFGLPTDFSSVVSYNPTVKNVIAELGGWYTHRGFFIDFQLPIVHTTARLNACETEQIPGGLGYIEGYFTPDAVDSMNLLSSAEQFFQQEAVPALGNDVIFNPLQVSKWIFANSTCHDMQKQTRVADIIVRLGYDAWVTERACLKAYGRVSAPAGNKPEGIVLFESVVGNGGLWGLGAGISGQLSIWNRPACNAALFLFLDAYAQHLFKAKQKRSFDLVAKPNSRYMLAQKLGPIRQDPSLSGTSDAGVEFQNEYAPVANLTYGCVNVSVAVEGEITTRLTGFLGSWQTAVGYNFWGRSGEHISYASLPCALQDGTWALKGDAQVIGFRITDNDPVRLAAVQNADIHNGTNNFPTGFNGFDPEQNPGVVNRVVATTGAGIDVVALPFAALGETNTSNPAPTLGACDVDLRGTSGVSNSIFGYIAYAPVGTCWCVEPRVELGGQAEFGGSSCANTQSSACGNQRCALSTWGVWVTLGVGF